VAPIHVFLTPLYAFLLGLCIGSFLNVCVLRLRSGDHIAIPPVSRCPRCKHPLSWFENIPVLSYLVLRARCRHCHRPISPQYPLVEGATGLLFAWAAWTFHDPFRVVASYFWASFLVLLVVNDIKWRILPHVFNNLFRGAGFLYGPAAGKGVVPGILNSVEGFLGAGALMLLMGHLYPKGLGGGDVKMVSALGAWLGLAPALLVIVLAFGIGAVLTLPFLAVGKVHRRTLLPFGPFLAVAAVFAWFKPEEVRMLLDRMA
jgi:leader peptidase (prepilin peptidase)/N-methyltransferase